MWPLFYLPWVLTLHNPTLGFVGTTAFMIYHYASKGQIIQRIEMQILPTPMDIIESYYQKHGDAKAESRGEEKPEKSESQVEKDELPSPSKGDARREGEDSKEEEQVPEKVKNHYSWRYSTWA